jgi:hypothetical protein
MKLMINSQPVQVEFNEELEDLARIIGEDKFMQVLHQFSGMNLYFPQKVNRAIERQMMLNDYANLNQLPNITQNRIFSILSARYGKSERWIRELVTRGTAA